MERVTSCGGFVEVNSIKWLVLYHLLLYHIYSSTFSRLHDLDQYRVNVVEGVKVRRLPLPALLLPAPCNIREACLGKYQRRDYEKIGNDLTSMLFDSE